MSRERGQALIEAIIAVPVGVLCAAALVDCSLLVRDRIVVAQAASRAAEARIAGTSAADAARAVLPAALREAAVVELHADRVVVRTGASARAARLLPDTFTMESTVHTDVEEAAR